MKELIDSYKNREIIDRGAGSMYNSYRSKVYNQKGKKIGFPDSWKSFKSFKEEMCEGWEFGLILIRKDDKLPYSRENCIWVSKGDEQIKYLIKLEYNGVEKTLFEWCEEFELNYGGVKLRYYRCKNYTPEQILFGKEKQFKRELLDVKKLTRQSKRDKISKMITAYRHKDKKKGFESELDIDYVLNFIEQPCIYCGDTDFIGLDRIDNNIGHIKSNIVPCCYTCNITRNNNFTYNEMLVLGKTIKEIKSKRNGTNK